MGKQRLCGGLALAPTPSSRPSMNPTTSTPIHPDLSTFDPNEQLASVLLSNVTDFKTRLNLRAVSTAFLHAERQDASTPVDVETTHRFGEICHKAGKHKHAYEWIKKASEQDQGQSTFNNCDSMLRLAACLQKGKGVEKNLDKAMKWCKRAAEAGSTHAMMLLGFSYFAGLQGVAKDKAMAVMWLQRAVAGGDHPNALFVLGQMFIKGDGVDKDVTLGVEYLEKAADLGHPVAQNQLGMMYKDGREGVVQDVEMGLKWLEKAAEQGEAEAQNVLGLHYLQTEKYEKSVSHWEKAAEQGKTTAQLGLGLCYANGLGVEINIETSLDFILKAAEGGDEHALQTRAQAMQALFQHAVSMTDASIANRPESLRLMRKLADLGHGPAEDMLGK
jgi:TPR repeat protein